VTLVDYSTISEVQQSAQDILVLMSDATHDESHLSQSHGTGVMNALVPLARDLRHQIPEVMKAFGDLHGAVMKPGALDSKTKELIALAISVSHRCDGCISSHARGAARQNATEAEVAEAIGVAVLMTGGPATVYGPRALAAFKEYAQT
jgi:AhpD family alkylhydroperoxidase